MSSVSRKMEIVDSKCRDCSAPIKIAMMGVSGPETFTESELGFARDAGVLIEKKFSEALNETYLANTCPKCGSFIGQYFVHEHQGLGKSYLVQ